MTAELEVGEHIGWNHGESQVYAARWQGQDAVLKRHRELRKHARERYGYAVWKHTGLLPELLHMGTERLELVLERVPAASALEQPQTQLMYRAAGAALRRLHGAAPRSHVFDDGREDVRQLAHRYLPRAVSVLPDLQVQEVERQVRALLHGPFPGVVLRHADYTARNWLWDGSRFTVIDLEMARPGPAGLDVAKMTNTLSLQDGGEALLKAFQSGYGREWSEEEQRFLHAVRAFDALVMAVWCHTHGDPEGQERFGESLNRLVPAR